MSVSLSLTCTLQHSRLSVQLSNWKQSPRIHSLGSPLRRSKYLVSPSVASRSTGSESSAESEDTASLLDTVQVFDLNGKGIAISDLWKERKTVVSFARHFGCVLCRKRADYLAAKKDVMDAAGVALVLIGPGSVDQSGLKIIQAYMEGYRQDWRLSFEQDTRTRGGWYAHYS